MSNTLNSDSDEDMRFSDEKLYQFHADFREHVERCEEQFSDGNLQFKQLIEAQQKNTESIAFLIEETRAVIQLHKDIQGATRVGKGLQSFLAWVIKWPLIGAGLYAMINWVIKHLG